MPQLFFEAFPCILEHGISLILHNRYYSQLPLVHILLDILPSLFLRLASRCLPLGWAKSGECLELSIPELDMGGTNHTRLEA